MSQMLATLKAYSQRYEKSARGWSRALYASTILIALSSALAGALPKMGTGPVYDNIGLLLGIIGATVATLASQIRFANKRAANRAARTEVDALIVELQFGGMSDADVASRLVKAIRAQGAAVTGPVDSDLVHQGPGETEAPEATD